MNMAQTVVVYQDQTTMINLTITDFTKLFDAMEAKLDKSINGTKANNLTANIKKPKK